jgi:outer membrane protein assembly factor BamB
MRRIKGTYLALWFLSATMLVLVAGCGNDKPADYVLTKRIEKTILAPTLLEKVGLQYYWKTQQSLPLVSGEQVTGFWALEENLYFLTNHKNLYAMDAMIGTFKWVARVTPVRSERVFGPMHVAGVRMPEDAGTAQDILSPRPLGDYEPFNAVVINTSMRVLVINRTTGKVIRDVPFKSFSATSQGVCDGQRFYVGAGGGLCVTVDLIHAVRSWHFDLSGFVKAPLQLHMGKLYIATLDGTLFSLNADSSGGRRWERPFDAAISKPFRVDDRGIFLNCDDDNLYALGFDGKKKWEANEIQGDVAQPLVVGQDSVYQSIAGEGLYAIDVNTGKVQWNNKTASRMLTKIQDTTYLLDGKKLLLLVEPTTGKVNHTLPMQGFDFVTSRIGDSAIFAATRNGKAYCIRRKQAGRITLDMLK